MTVDAVHGSDLRGRGLLGRNVLTCVLDDLSICFMLPDPCNVLPLTVRVTVLDLDSLADMGAVNAFRKWSADVHHQHRRRWRVLLVVSIFMNDPQSLTTEFLWPVAAL